MSAAKEIQFITIQKTAELLNKSPQSVRQLITRGKLRKQEGASRINICLQDVITYHAKKKKLPAWEENIPLISEKSFVSIQSASTALIVQPVYIVKLIQKKLLEGYVTVHGDIMVAKESINVYLRRPDHDTRTTPNSVGVKETATKSGGVL